MGTTIRSNRGGGGFATESRVLRKGVILPILRFGFSFLSILLCSFVQSVIMEARRAHRRASYDSQKSELSDADRMREKKRQKTQYSLRQAGMSESDRASMNKGRRVQYTKKQAGGRDV